MDRNKLVVTLLCLLISSGISWLAWRSLRSGGPSVELFQAQDDTFRDLIEEYSAEPMQRIRNFADSPLIRYRVPEELAHKFFPLHHPWNAYDPHAYYDHAPDLNAWRSFKEHPDGGFYMRTNSLGMRCDYEPAAEQPDLRVLVAGDSHIDGICNNSEAFSAVAEAQLEQQFPGRSVEVLNGARGGYSFYNYLGTYEKYAPDLAPDALIVFVAGSNDLTGVLRLGHLFNRTRRIGGSDEVWDRRDRAIKAAPDVVGTGPAMLYYFKSFPDEIEAAFEFTRQICEELRRLCERDSVRLIFAFHPSSNAIGWENPPEGLATALEILGLTPEDEALHDALGARFLAMLDEMGIESIDLTPAFAGKADDSWWRTDLHMKPAGQARMVTALMPWLAASPELR